MHATAVVIFIFLFHFVPSGAYIQERATYTALETQQVTMPNAIFIQRPNECLSKHD